MSTKIVQVKPLTLSSNIGTSNTTAIVTDMVGLDGVDLTQTDFGTIIYGTFEPNTTREEAVSFTITSNTAGVANINFTASGRGLIGKSPYGTGGITYSHSAGAKLVISNNPNLFNKFTAKDNNEVVTAAWSFPTPTLPAHPATKSYADALVSSGAADASTTTKGLARLTTSPNVTLGTATVTIATPAVVTFTAHGLTLNDSVQFTTTGALPTGLVVSTTYFVISAGLTANAFQVSATFGGTAINTTGTQSGVHTLIRTTPRVIAESDTRVPSTNTSAALAGGGSFGTPSGSNKFVTQEFFSARTIRYQYDLAGSPFTWTKQTGLRYVIVEAWGAGGGASAGAGSGRNGGGGGGGYNQKRIEAATLGATETVTVATGGTTNASGGNSTFGAHVTGFGGGGGGFYITTNVSGGGGGGVTSAGANGLEGGAAGAGNPGNPIAGNGNFGASTESAMGGSFGGGGGANISNAAGNSLYGGGGGGQSLNTAGGRTAYAGAGGLGGVNGANGSVPGGGGGGGTTTNGNGGAGRIIVTEYYS